MSDKSKIEWTVGDDGTPGATWNPVTGCTIEIPGDGCAFEGAWIVKGDGGFRICEDFVFSEVYEPASEPADQVAVSREDLRALLADNELTTEAAQVAYGRLSAAAEATR